MPCSLQASSSFFKCFATVAFAAACSCSAFCNFSKSLCSSCIAADTATLAADAVTGAKIADDALDSEHYTDGSIDTAHLAADAVTGAKIADDAIDSEHYVD